MERVLEILDQKSLPSINLIHTLCRQVSNVLVDEPNVLRIDPSVKVVGSLYGQYFDLLQIINQQSPVNYLFFGNYTGFGKLSLQTILFLFCLKVKSPNKISLLRGAQETQQAGRDNGLMEQIFEKYGNDEAWRCIQEVFKYLPVAAVIGDSYLAVSGGIENYNSLSQIRTIARTSERLDESGLFWGNLNNPFYGKQIDEQKLATFLSKNKLRMMIRSNGVYKQGFEKKNDNIISLCSCPFFQSKYNNQGCVLVIQEDLSFEVIQFRKVAEPGGCFLKIMK